MNLDELPKDALVLGIDADSISYSLIHNLSFKDVDGNLQMEGVDKVDEGIKDFIGQLYQQVGASHVAGFIGRGKCFRYSISKTKPYKGNRPPKTEFHLKWSQYINEYLVQNYHFQYVDGIEADDAISILAIELRKLGINHIICSNDKDVDQVWGNHYSMNKRIFYYISEEQASLLLHTQYITGDTSDNIAGLPGKGKVYAEKLLKNYTLIESSIQENHARNVHWAYLNYGPYDTEQANYEYFQEQKTLLTMLTSHEGFVPLCHVIDKALFLIPEPIITQSELDLAGL